MYTIELLLDSKDSFLTTIRGPIPYKKLQNFDLFHSRKDAVAQAVEAQMESHEITGKSAIAVKVHEVAWLANELIPIAEIEDFQGEFLNNLKIEMGSEKYLKAIIILERLSNEEFKSIPADQRYLARIYNLMDEELYVWNEFLKSWETIF